MGEFVEVSLGISLDSVGNSSIVHVITSSRFSNLRRMLRSSMKGDYCSDIIAHAIFSDYRANLRKLPNGPRQNVPASRPFYPEKAPIAPIFPINNRPM
jgi:hypothetical protein